ncbi:platelet binding protein GspB-like isoform X2 [Littorina saxatilis]|uniref:Histone-lysine N-methyltransferase, H3 lysine-79 specific n=1 Tax=Littorina saxatilis TaxID=31220 RepID=A0AAN9B9W0_9CAEN
MELELKLHSPVGGESIAYTWPVSGSEGKEGGEDVVDTIKWACEEYQELKQTVQNCILQDYDVKSYESIKSVCDRYNKAVDSFRQLGSTRHQRPVERAGMKLVRHVIQQCYNYAVRDPEQLNHYEPFSPEVYGETSFDLVEQIIKTIKIKEDDYFIDLGSGVGQVALQVAAATRCKFCYGIEKAEWPATYAVDMDRMFKKWMSFFGKSYGDYLLEKGDFLIEDIRERIESASVIFVNNFAFGPQVDHHLKSMFSNMKEGAKIVSSKAFCPLNFRITDRNLSDIGSIMQVQELSPLSGAVSWTGKAFAYYIHTIDRTLLEKYFQRLKNPKAALIDEPRRDRRGRIMDKKSIASLKDKENSRLRRCGGDHTYQAAKALDFDSASNASTITNTMSDDNSNTVNSAEDDSSVMGPTTRRKWTEWANNTDLEKSVLWKQRLKKKSLKRIKNGTIQKKKNNKFKKKLRVRRVAVAVAQQAAQDRGTNSAEELPTGVKVTKKQVKVAKPPALSLDSLNLLHTHTVLSTTGQGVEDSTKYNDRRMAALAGGPFKASTQRKTVRSLDMMMPAVDQWLDICRKRLLAYLSLMQTNEYIDKVQHQRDLELERHHELRNKEAMYEKEISDLQKNSVELIKKRIGELGVEANTPSELLGQHHLMKQQNHQLQRRRSELQQQIHCLKSEQLQLVTAQKLLSEQNGLINNHKKNGVVRPLETERILKREVLSAYTNNQRMVQQANQLELEIQRLEIINNQLIAADTAAAAATSTPATITTTTPTTTSSKPKSGSAKGTKRKSGGSPATPVPLPPSTEKMKEKLDMKENLEAYGRRVNKLKSEVTAALTESMDGIAAMSGTTPPVTPSSSVAGDLSRAGQSIVAGIKQEAKFQPPDLSIKGLLEKTKALPNGAIKHEVTATVGHISSSTSSSMNSDILPQTVVKAEAREVVNGAKKRKSLNGINLSHARPAAADAGSLSKGGNPHSTIPGSNALSSPSVSSSPSPSTTSLASASGKPSSPWAEERLNLAHDLLRFHETPVQQATPPVVSSSTVTSYSSPANGDVLTSAAVESHRMQNNYSPISRPSSQSSTEGMDLPCSMSSSAAMSRLVQTYSSRSAAYQDTSVFHQSVAPGGRLGVGMLPLPSVPVTMTIDVGAMSGSCVSTRRLLPSTPMSHHAAQYQPYMTSSSRSKGTASGPGSTQLVASSSRPSSSSKQQAAAQRPAVPTTSTPLTTEQHVVIQQHTAMQQAQQTMVIQSLLRGSAPRPCARQPIWRPTSVEVSAPFSTTATTTAAMVPVSVGHPAAPMTFGSVITHSIPTSSCYKAPQEPKAPSRPRKYSRSRSRSGSQSHLPQPVPTNHHVVTLPNGLVPFNHTQHSVAKMIGPSVISAAGDAPTPVQMAMVNGIPISAVPQPQHLVAGNQKDTDQTANPEAKPQADDSSGFQALLAFASSEHDLQKSLKRKLEEEEMPSPVTEGMPVLSADTPNSDSGYTSALTEKPCLSDAETSLKTGLGGKKAKTVHSQNNVNKRGSSGKQSSRTESSSESTGLTKTSHGKSGRSRSPSPAPSRKSKPDEAAEKNTATPLKSSSIETVKEEKKAQEENEKLSVDSLCKDSVEAGMEDSTTTEKVTGKPDKSKSSASKGKSAAEKKKSGSSKSHASKELAKCQKVETHTEQKPETEATNSKDSGKADVKEKDKSQNDAKEKTSNDTSKSVPVRSLRGSSSKPGEREARLDKHQRKIQPSSSKARKPSPVDSFTAFLDSKQKEEASLDRRRKKKVVEKVSPAPSPSRSPSKPRNAGDEDCEKSKDKRKESQSSQEEGSSKAKKSHDEGKSDAKSKESHDEGKSDAKSKESHDEGKSDAKSKKSHDEGKSDAKSKESQQKVSTPTSSSKSTKEGKPVVEKEATCQSSASPKPENRSKDKKSSTKSDNASVGKDRVHSPSASPKPADKAEKHSKSSPSSRNESPSHKKDVTSKPSPSPKSESQSDKHKKDVTNKPSTSPKSDSQSDKHRNVSPVPKKESSSRTASPSSKPGHAKEEKQRKCSPSSRSVSPADRKSAPTGSVSPKADTHHGSSTLPAPLQKSKSGNKDKRYSDGHNSTPVAKKEALDMPLLSPKSVDKKDGKDKKSSSKEGGSKTSPTPSPIPAHKIKTEGERVLSTKDKAGSPDKKKTPSSDSSPSRPHRGEGPISDLDLQTGEGQQQRKRPSYEQQVSVGFAPQQKTENDTDQDTDCPYKPRVSSGGKSVALQSKGENVKKNGEVGKGDNPPSQRVTELKGCRERRPSRSCNSSPQPQSCSGDHKDSRMEMPSKHPSSAPSSRTASPVPGKDRSGHGVSHSPLSHSVGHEKEKPRPRSRSPVSQSSRNAGQDKDQMLSPVSLTNSSGEPGREKFQRKSTSPVGYRPRNQIKIKPEPENMKIPGAENTEAKDTKALAKGSCTPGKTSPRSSPKLQVDLRKSSPTENAYDSKEQMSPTKTVTVTLEDIAPSLKDSKSMGSYIVSDSPMSKSPRSGDYPEKSFAAYKSPPQWRGPHTPPGSPVHSEASGRQSRRDSRVSSTSSCSSSRSSSSTSRARSTSSGQSGTKRQKSPRKANARRRSLRSYSTSTTTSTTAISSEEESDDQSSKQDSFATPAAAQSPSVVSRMTVSPLFGSLGEPEKKLNPVKKEEVPTQSDSSASSSESSTSTPVEEEPPKELTLGRRDSLVEPAAVQGRRLSFTQLGGSENKNLSAKYPAAGSATKAPLSMSSKKPNTTTASLPLPDMTKPPPGMYSGGHSGYPSSPLPAPRPGYLPVGSPPNPGYISHSPNIPQLQSPPTLVSASQGYISHSPNPPQLQSPPSVLSVSPGYISHSPSSQKQANQLHSPPNPGYILHSPKAPKQTPQLQSTSTAMSASPGYISRSSKSVKPTAPLQSSASVVSASQGYVSHTSKALKQSAQHHPSPSSLSVPPGYVSHSPCSQGQTPQSQNRQFSQYRNANNNNISKVGDAWGSGGHYSSSSTTKLSSAYSSNPHQDVRGMNSAPQYYHQPSAPPPMSLQQQAGIYPASQTYPHYNKYQHGAAPGRPATDSRSAQPARMYMPPNNWHPYGRSPSLNSSGMRRQ